MINRVAGFIGILMAVGFFAYYAVRLNKAPLWIVLIIAIVFAIADYVQSIREGRRTQ